MRIDAHLHCSGKENASGVLRTLDEAQIDVAVLLAPFLDAPYHLSDPYSLRSANQYLADLVRDHTDRLYGFAVVNPLHESAVSDLETAIERNGLKGLKLVPSGWYPYEDCAHRVYEKAAELKIPILFHSGIFIDGRSGRFCRPVFFEAIRDHPGLRVTLAHLGWPWTDEAIAVGLIDLINGLSAAERQFRFDISFGPPPIYRRAVLERAFSVLGSGNLQFGSDRFFPCSGSHILSSVHEVEELCDSLQIDPNQRVDLFQNTAARWLGISIG